MAETDLIAEFKMRHEKTTVPAYDDRETRNRWAASIVDKASGNTVLNLGGGGKRHLEKYLPSAWRVHELDIMGDCDTTVNLDEISRLPFEDGAFDVCCAFDVLEHLEQFHLIAQEIYRVARSTVLISLPNAAAELPAIWRNLRNYNDPLQNGVYSKYYGLPVAPPSDRHRWWLTFEDIVRFALWFEHANSCVVQFYVPDDAFSIKRKLFRWAVGERLYLNFCCSTVWIKIGK